MKYKYHRHDSSHPGTMSDSRLDKTVKLLESSSSASFRSLAAKQIGSIVHSQPLLARPVLEKVIKRTKSLVCNHF